MRKLCIQIGTVIGHIRGPQLGIPRPKNDLNGQSLQRGFFRFLR